MTLNQSPIKITLDRPEACRLYSLLGSCLWLESVIRKHKLLEEAEDVADLQRALQSFQLGMKEMGVARATHIKEEIYKKLCDNPANKSTTHRN